MHQVGVGAWAERVYGGTDYAAFSSRGFLEEVIPRLRLDHGQRRTLELGTGVGPAAIWLAERGFEVHAVDLIPEAIDQARRIAMERSLDVRFAVMDVTRMPHHGPGYDLIVDSYCLQGIALDQDREAVFGAVKARLNRQGYYLVSSAMYDPSRHRSDQQVADRRTGRVFDRYDETGLYDRDTDLYYKPYDQLGTNRAEIDEAITVNGARFFPFRRYRTGEGLRREVEAYDLNVLYQSCELGENLIAVHRGSGTSLSSRPLPASPRDAASACGRRRA